jgi:gas vesicle protein
MSNFITGNDKSRMHQVALLAAGSLVGAGLALLFAPHSGRETRRSLARKGELIKMRARDLQSDLNSKMDTFFVDVRRDMRSCLNDGKSWTDGKKHELEQALKAGKKKLEKEVARVLHS